MQVRVWASQMFEWSEWQCWQPVVVWVRWVHQCVRAEVSEYVEQPVRLEGQKSEEARGDLANHTMAWSAGLATLNS